jgi:hypothetical protein
MIVRRFDDGLPWAQILTNITGVNAQAGNLACRPDFRVVCMLIIQWHR